MGLNLNNNPPEPRIIFNKNSEEQKFEWSDFFAGFWRSWIRKIIVYLIIPIIILNFWLFRYDDFTNGCHIKIQPAFIEWNNLDIKKAIELLKKKSFPDYQKMCSSVESISPELACGGIGGGCFYSSNPNEIVVSTIFRRKENHMEQTAAIIVHEVCHLFQHKENRAISEQECYNDYCRILSVMGVREGYDTRCSGGKFK